MKHGKKPHKGSYANYNGVALKDLGKKGMSVIEEAKNLSSNKHTTLTTGTNLKKIMGS